LISVTSVPPDLLIKEPKWCPTEKQIEQMHIEALRKLCLESIEWTSAGTINCLTFVFSNDTRSPARFTYLQEPASAFTLTSEVNRIDFGLRWVTGKVESFTLCRIHLTDPSDMLMTSVDGGFSESGKSTLKLKRGDKVVSAKVTVDGNAPIDIQFLVVNLEWLNDI